MAAANTHQGDDALGTQVPPHFVRLLERLDLVATPVVLLWGWPGTGKRRFLAWLSQGSPAKRAVRFVKGRVRDTPEAFRREYESAEVRWFLLDDWRPDSFRPLTDQLDPHQSLVVTVDRHHALDADVRQGVIGTSEVLLRETEVERLVAQRSTKHDATDFASALYRRVGGWLRPLELCIELEDASQSLEVQRDAVREFLRTEVLRALDPPARAVLERLIQAPYGVVENEILGAGKERAERAHQVDQLIEHHGLVEKRGARLLIPNALRFAYGTDVEGAEPMRVVQVPASRSGEGPADAAQASPKSAPAPSFELRLFGKPSLARREDAGRTPIHWPTRRVLYMLAYLATRPGLLAGRDELSMAVWPEASEDAVSRNFHPTVSLLRKTLEVQPQDRKRRAVLFEKGVYRLNPEFDWWIDVLEFERSVLLGRPTEGLLALGPDVHAWEEAWRLYAGPFLDGHLFDWVEGKREELQRLYLDVLRGLGEAYLEEGKVTDAEDAFRSVLNVDPIQETVHLEIMRIYASRGRRDLVRKQYERLGTLLRQELGVDPMPLTAAEYHRLMG